MNYTTRVVKIDGGSVTIYTSVEDGKHWLTLGNIAQVFCLSTQMVKDWAQTERDLIVTETNNEGYTLYSWTDMTRLVKYVRGLGKNHVK